jgi:hypothetical protein
MQVKKVLQSQAGSILISVLLGLGLAAMFRRACSGDGCLVIKAPNLSEVQKHLYKVESDCYKYTPEVIPCPRKSAGVLSV